MVITVSGHQQSRGPESPNIEAWRAIARRVGEVECHWAGSGAAQPVEGLVVIQRPRRQGVRGIGWLARTMRAVVRQARADAARGTELVIAGAEPWGWIVAYTAARLAHVPWVMEVHGDFLPLPPGSFS